MEVTISDLTRKQLRSTLEKEGLDVERPRFRQFWQVYKKFLLNELIIDNENILACVECITPDEREDKFCASFIIQFSVNDAAGNYTHLEQMGCNFCCDPSKVPDREDSILWSNDFLDISAFLDAVEQAPSIRNLLLVEATDVVYWNTKL